jgi:ribosomal protein S18 acetylase RimI-like enzyme
VDKIVEMASLIKWTGRLWRDPLVDKKEAWAETERFIRTFDGAVVTDPSCSGIALLGIEGGSTRVALVGVLALHRREGIARRLLSAGLSPQMIAGTYSDNEPAIGLYESLGWQEIDRVKVWHL